MAKKPSIVEVEWEDSAAEGGWSKRDRYLAQEPAQCRTVGYLLKADRKKVILLQSCHPKEDRFTDSLTIPRSCVTSMRKLY